MKILLLGEKFSANLGDGVICQVTENFISSQMKCDILSKDISFRHGYLDNKSIGFYPLRKKIGYIKRKLIYLFREIGLLSYFDVFKSDNQVRIKMLISQTEPDAIIFAGGQLFMDTFLSRIATVISISEKMQIPIYFNACGCGNFLFRDDLYYLRRVFNSPVVRYISVRDGYARLKEFDERNLLSMTVDSALLCERFFECNKSSKHKIGIGIMYSKYCNTNAQILFWCKLLKTLISKNIDFEVFCNGASSDFEFAKYIFNKIKFSYAKHLAALPRNPEELITIISSYDSLISMRLHSLIVAYSLKIPAIAIEWDKKISQFYRAIGNERYCLNLGTDADMIMNSYEQMIDDGTYFNKYMKCVTMAEENLLSIVSLLQSENGKTNI